MECHKKSYLQSWSFIFADYPERNFDCTSTSKFSMKLQWNLSCRVCKINFRTCRFWNCHWFWNLMFISWRNLCLENVYLTCDHGKYTSIVPHHLICSVYLIFWIWMNHELLSSAPMSSQSSKIVSRKLWMFSTVIHDGCN